jgi:hypothetical protein
MLTLTEKLPIQPTLSLYLGGSGIAVGESLLRLMASLDPADRGLIEPFFIDSQAPGITDHERSRHYCYQNLGQFFEPLFQEFTENRFPENLGVNPVMNSCEGCGVTRIFGAASLVNCRDDFAALVDDAAARLRARRASSTQPMQVFLTASSCGGTGAGMIVDAAAMVRHFFRERGENPRIFLFLIGPTVYLEDPKIPLREDQRDRMRASTYALLKELHHFAQGNPFRSAYRLRDKVIDIGNARDDDRLFDWVYFLDGRPELAGATRSLDEVAWTIAEAQLHISLTEVGRKVAESMPNQREERVRDYAPDFVHADNKDRLSEAARKRLERSSRKTFLASFAVRNVRFPAEELKTWFRRGWVRDALQKCMTGRLLKQEKELIDQFDDILGFSDSEIKAEGLLADLGLVRENLLSRVKEDADPAKGLPPAPSPSGSPDRVLDGAAALLTAARAVVEDMKKDASLLPADGGSPAEGGIVSCAALLATALPSWNELWAEGLGKDGKIAARLWQLAWDPAFGRGLTFLDDLLVHTSELLTDLATGPKRQRGAGNLEESMNAIQQRLSGLAKKRDHEQKGVGAIGRNLLVRLKLTKTAHSEGLRKSMRTFAGEVNVFRAQVIVQRGTYIANALAPRAWLEAARQIRKWRDEVLAPALTAADNAFTLADNQWRVAQQALATHQGVNERGRWEAHTTVQIADTELLAILGERVAKVSVEDLVLAPLHGDGIARERHRLTSRSFATFDRETIVDMLYAHVRFGTENILTFLDNGWMLPEVAQLLHTSAAQKLDEGSEPLVSFSRAALGQPLQSYLLTPPDLLLPEPFGRRLGRMTRLVSRGPLQLGVVSFVYGIPPNALQSMRELFEQYTAHIGDQARNQAHDRFPLHIFRTAAETFDEPHSPLEFQTDDKMLESLPAAVQMLWPGNGSNGGSSHPNVRLRIRQWDPAVLDTDMNQVIELLETVMRHLIRHPEEASRIFNEGGFPQLERLYNSRCHRSTELWTPRGGNGHDDAGSGKGADVSPPEDP